MNFIEAILLGIIEGITEFLPISSTGHLILASTLLGIPDSNFLKSFEIAIQLGAILSVVILYRKMLFRNIPMMMRVIVAFIPTGIVGFLAYKTIKKFLMGNEMVVVISLIAGGIILIVFELFHRDSTEKESGSITYKQAAAIGLFQCLAMIPGVSRSASTIIGGLLLGINRKTIVEFSFLLAIPTMAAATGLDLLKTSASFSALEVQMLAVGFVVAFVIAWLSVKFLLFFIRSHTFIAFGVYRIIAGILFWLIVL